MPHTAKKMKFGNVAELLAALGDIPPERISLDPQPGTATKRDLLRKYGKDGKRYELVERTLVEKPMGFPESFFAAQIIGLLFKYLEKNEIGFVCSSDALIRLFPGTVRVPDVCYVSWASLPDQTVPNPAIASVIPELVVEVLSPSNTETEMSRKRREYFRAGVRVIWFIDPKTNSAEVYTAPGTKAVIPESGKLDGGDILPGFELPLQALFARRKRPKKPKPPKA